MLTQSYRQFSWWFPVTLSHICVETKLPSTDNSTFFGSVDFINSTTDVYNSNSTIVCLLNEKFYSWISPNATKFWCVSNDLFMCTSTPSHTYFAFYVFGFFSSQFYVLDKFVLLLWSAMNNEKRIFQLSNFITVLRLNCWLGDN